MNKKYKYLIRNTTILTISNFSSKVLAFFFVPLYTNILTTSEYGVFDLASTTIQLLIPLLTLNISDAVMRYMMDSTEFEEVAIGIKYVVIGIFVTTLLLLFNTIFDFIPVLRPYGVFIFLLYVSTSLNELLIQVAKGFERIQLIGIIGVISTITVLIFNVLFLVFWDLGLVGFFIANIMGQLLPTLFYIMALKPWKYLGLGNIFEKSKYEALESEMLKYCTPLIATSVAWWINSASDRYVVTFLVGISANGILSMAYKIPSIITILQGIFIQAWQISAIKEISEDSNSQFYQHTFEYCMSIMCVVGSILILFNKLLSRFLFSKDFFGAWEYVPFLIISAIINCASGFIGGILGAKKETIPVFYSTILGALCNLFLNILLCLFIGSQGVTIATAISSAVIYAVRIKRVGKTLTESNNYNIVLYSWMILALQAISIIYLNNYVIASLLVVVIFILYRKYVIKLLYKTFCLIKRKRFFIGRKQGGK